MMKVLTLATMVGILAEKGELVLFIASLDKPHSPTRDGSDFTPQLVARVTNIVREEMQQHNGFAEGFLLWTTSHCTGVQGRPQGEGFFTPARSKNLLNRLWEQRDAMLAALKRSPISGLSVVLHIIRSNTLQDPTISDNRYACNFRSIAGIRLQFLK